MVLTDEQQAAVERIVRSRDDVQTLGGFAGTGKTTIIRELVRRLPGYAVCAYTGKAANVLRRKGIAASTIHSLIYHPKTDEYGKVLEPVEFELVPPALFAHLGIIVDEASMVGKAIHADLLSFGVPLVFVGDHGQLEPVGDTGFNLMKSPDVVLETIHRNAGSIARFAEHLRRGGDACGWADPKGGAGEVSVTTMADIGRIHVDRDWQLICAYNRTRCSLNAMVRDHLGMPAGEPVPGDRVICLQNNKLHGLFNGMQGTIEDISTRRHRLLFNADERVKVWVTYLADAFGADAKPEWSGDVVLFDWAYCVTCHKAQGDEFDNVCVIEQRCRMWEHRRWAYTAASRARRKLVWIVG